MTDPVKSPALMACPFCGGHASLFSAPGWGTVIGCDDATCVGHGVVHDPDDVTAAIAGWNRRASPASPPAEALPSQTSGAEAGDVVAWLSTDADGERAATVNADTADRWRGLGRSITPLYALAKPASEPAGGGVGTFDAWYATLDSTWMEKLSSRDAACLAWHHVRRAALSSPASSSPAEAEALQAGVEAVRQNAIMRKALREIAAPIEGTPIGDPWAFYADLQAVAEAALSSAPAQEDGIDIRRKAYMQGWRTALASQEDGSKDLGAHPRGPGQSTSGGGA